MVKKNIKILTWFNFFTDFKLYAPIAIIYFAQVTGSYALGMSVFSIVFITSAVAELPTGILSDFVGRRKTMIFGALSAVIYSVFYARTYALTSTFR
jgi:MFS family permease